GITIFLLPQSEYLVGQVLQGEDGSYQFSGQVTGVTLQQIAPVVRFSEFALQTVDLTITQPAALFGIWSRQDQPDTVTVAEGEALLSVNGDEIRVGAGQGYFADGIQTAATPIDAPYSAARVEATLFGCPGNVLITLDVDDLRVRSGPGTNYFAVGLVPDGLPISVMNVNERGDWVRIQFRSYFGWVFRHAVEDDCGDVAVLSNTAPVEPIRQFVDITGDEASFLTPFFLSQEEDRYRYQYEG
ncbi:MAG: SH3 domain-containing protein, partial [Anaerolineae bacterium]|nr:SH3 domain-containing protein [Anaerolineae bacterium]